MFFYITNSRDNTMADFKLSLLMTAIMSCLITGCGGGGHSSSEGSQNTQLEVQVIDGYLTGIDVCTLTFDQNYPMITIY